jgi:hypothetical protein
MESFNLITSVGAAATQTVRHLHIHLIPRREGDALALPWTGQQKPRLYELPPRVKLPRGAREKGGYSPEPRAWDLDNLPNAPEGPAQVSRNETAP